MEKQDIKCGDIVRYKAEWCDGKERKLLFVVKEWNDATDRFLILAINSKEIYPDFTFDIVSTVDRGMIEPWTA